MCEMYKIRYVIIIVNAEVLITLLNTMPVNLVHGDGESARCCVKII